MPSRAYAMNTSLSRSYGEQWRSALLNTSRTHGLTQSQTRTTTYERGHAKPRGSGSPTLPETGTKPLSVPPPAALEASLDARAESAISAVEGGYILLAPRRRSAEPVCRGGERGGKFTLKQTSSQRRSEGKLPDHEREYKIDAFEGVSAYRMCENLTRHSPRGHAALYLNLPA